VASAIGLPVVVGPVLLLFVENRTIIALAAIVGGICLSSIVLVGIFSPQNMMILPWVVGALCALGIALGFFASRGAS
jgi:hypothetical protein